MRHLKSPANSLKRGPARELLQPIAKQNEVGGFALQGNTRRERREQTRGAEGGQLIQVWYMGRFKRGLSIQDRLWPVGQPVKNDEKDRQGGHEQNLRERVANQSLVSPNLL